MEKAYICEKYTAMKPIVIFLFFILSYNSLYSQNNGDKVFFRAGDKLTKSIVSNTSIGESGQDIMWNFSSLDDSGLAVTTEYCNNGANGSSNVEVTDNTRFYVRQDSCGVYCTGYENHFMSNRYDTPICTVPFPLFYGNRSEGVFHGTGTYCDKMFMRVFGTYVSEIDGEGGMLLPNGDTLYNVFRVHSLTVENSIPYDNIKTQEELLEHVYKECPFTEDSIRKQSALQHEMKLISEKYSWYADGYRYPVMEAVSYRKGTNAPQKITYLYCAPEKQTKMSGDTRSVQRLKRKDTNNVVELEADKDNGLPYEMNFNGADIIVRPKSDVIMPVSVTLYDSSGIVYRRSEGTGRDAMQVSCNGLPYGDYILKTEMSGSVYCNTIRYER